MPAPNLKEIEWAISELEQEESSFNVYAKLANLYTVRKEMLSDPETQKHMSLYSEASDPIPTQIEQYGDSDFLIAISGKDPAKAWVIMDELMETLRVVNARAYDRIMRKLSQL